MVSKIYGQAGTRAATAGHERIANNRSGHHTSSPRLKLPESKTVLWIGAAAIVVLFALAYFFLMPVAEVATVQRGTAISAVYGPVRIEPAFVVRIRAQNDGFIQLAETFSAGRGAIGKNVEKGQLLATIADQETARELKQARADLQAAIDRAALPLPSAELLKAAEDNLQRLEKVVGSGNVPAVEYQKAKSEANRLRGAVETERIERDRNLKSLEETTKKLEAQMKSAEVRSPIDGLQGFRRLGRESSGAARGRATLASSGLCRRPFRVVSCPRWATTIQSDAAPASSAAHESIFAGPFPEFASVCGRSVR